MASEDQKPDRKSEALWPFALILLGAAVVWVGYGYWITAHIPDGDNVERAQAMRGQFGDMFGAINALFSAMAFAVLIYTMWLQRKELRLQREELEATRIELSRTAAAQENSEKALLQQVEAMRRYAEAAADQVQAMRSLAHATEQQAKHDRELATSARHHADAMKDLASAIRDIKNRINR